MRDITKTSEALKHAKAMLDKSGEKVIFTTQDFYRVIKETMGLDIEHSAWLVSRITNILMYNGNIRRVQKGLYEKTNYGYGKKW